MTTPPKLTTAMPPRTGTPRMPDVLYTGPAVPVAYDPNWGKFTNLTKVQIAAFQAMPEDLVSYSATRRWQHEVRTADSLKSAFKSETVPADLAARYAKAAAVVKAGYDQHAKHVAAIGAKAVTTRAQIDAAFGTIAVA
jgi:hypothetical protein